MPDPEPDIPPQPAVTPGEAAAEQTPDLSDAERAALAQEASRAEDA
ncbi:hypothetical protein ACO2Q3_14400 [Caulobacter sp. KR2-114]